MSSLDKDRIREMLSQYGKEDLKLVRKVCGKLIKKTSTPPRPTHPVRHGIFRLAWS